ncbi:MAG: YggT family protein [Chloroflexi bacterium]|nr:YggT family protein [Chloroflexota bacterium]
MIANFISYLVTLLIFAIFGRVILDWLIVGGIMRHNHPIRDAVIRITEPILAPIRRYARIGMIDLSPMAAIIILTVIKQIVGR